MGKRSQIVARLPRAEPAREGGGLSRAPRGRAVRDPEPLGRRLGQHARGARFQALATTSGGFAFTLGRPDGQVTPAEVAAHVTALDRATPLPVSVDLEHGYGAEPQAASRAVELAAAAGAVGGSIEDWDPVGHLYDRGHATERVAAAVGAARGQPFPFTLTARAENHLRGNPDLDDTIARLQAFEAAGADVVYAPGLRTTEEIAAVCSAVTRPVNVLAVPGLSLAEIAAAGAQRVSVGSRLTWTAVDAAVDAARRMLDGDFGGLGSAPPLDDWFAQSRGR
jgi:2-methylisocitrate lyase-like PEP mutase family enzyme